MGPGHPAAGPVRESPLISGTGSGVHLNGVSAQGVIGARRDTVGEVKLPFRHIHWGDSLRRIGTSMEIEECRCGKRRMVWKVLDHDGTLWSSGWGSRTEVAARLKEYASEAPGPR